MKLHLKRGHTLQPSQKWKSLDLELFRAVHQIGDIEICNVIPNNDVRIDLLYEVPPGQ